MAMTKLETLHASLRARFAEVLVDCVLACHEVTLDVPAKQLLTVCKALRDEEAFKFEMLIDVCGVDYLTYGQSQWDVSGATQSGFSRAVDGSTFAEPSENTGNRFAVVYHLLSVSQNQRLRVRCFAQGEPPTVDSVMSIWRCADWFEREAFDLFGIVFKGHPDLRRILTDYGFVGHPFRKDFPLSGHVEVRYDAAQARVVYEPVEIEPRVLVPRVIRGGHEAHRPATTQVTAADNSAEKGAPANG